MDKSKIWEIKSKKEILKLKIFKIQELNCYLPSKKMDHNFYKIKLHDWVNIFALTSDNKIILVNQHRLGNNMVTTEVPAGAINKNEDPLESAKRELTEETGYTTENIFLLKKISVNPAIQDNYCYFFLALDCKKTSETNFDPSEELEVVLENIKKINDITQSDFMDNSLSFLSVMLAKEHLLRAGKI